MNDWQLRLFPPGRKEWGRSYINEFGADRGLLRVLAYSWYSTLKGATTMKTAIATLSIGEVAFGLLLGVLYTVSDDTPAMLVLAAGILVVQGGYTLIYMSGRLAGWEPWSNHALIAGETVSLLVVMGGFVVMTLTNPTSMISPADPEYGPVTVVGMIGAQAAATLFHYAVRDGNHEHTTH